MSDGTDLRQLVADEIGEQVTVADVIGEGTLEDSIDGDEIGAAVGREFGEQMGRELGAAVGREIHETLEEANENGTNWSALRSDLVTAIRDAVTNTIEEFEAGDSVTSMAKGITEGSGLDGILEEESGETDTDDSDAETADEADEADGTDEDDRSASDGEASSSDETPVEEATEPDATDLEGLRTETLAQFLEIVSYSDLQSIAKDVDVKANLSREEMTERIIETVSESDDGEFTTASNEE